MKKTFKIIPIMAALLVGAGSLAALAGCGSSDSASSNTASNANTNTMTFGTSMQLTYNNGVDPAIEYEGEVPMMYGVTELLVRMDANSEVQPWLAKSFKQKNDTTWEFVINDGIKFHNGKALDAAAVKASLERVIAKSDREAELKNINIDKITADGNTLTITTKSANPILPNQLTDPMWGIIDASEEVDGRTILSGTGPYKLVNCTDQELTVTKNDNYWNGTPKLDNIDVKYIADIDTVTMALQSGEINVAQGVPTKSLSLFNGNGFKLSTADTPRANFIEVNSEATNLSDVNVRQAIAYAINKQDFVDSIMSGYGTVAKGFFPATFKFGDSKLTAPEYDVAKAKELLKEAGWTDSDNNGYVDKDGKDLTIKIGTYKTRPELPKIAEAIQDDLKDIGVKAEIEWSEKCQNASDWANKDAWDLYIIQMTTAPYGDPFYMIDSALGEDGYYSDPNRKDATMQAMIEELRDEQDVDKRAELAVKIQQYAIDKGYVIVPFFVNTTLAMKDNVNGVNAEWTGHHIVNADTSFS